FPCPCPGRRPRRRRRPFPGPCCSPPARRPGTPPRTCSWRSPVRASEGRGGRGGWPRVGIDLNAGPAAPSTRGAGCRRTTLRVVWQTRTTRRVVLWQAGRAAWGLTSKVSPPNGPIVALTLRVRRHHRRPHAPREEAPHAERAAYDPAEGPLARSVRPT